MIEIEEALRLILSHTQTKPAERVSVVESVGRTLAEEVASDVDSPPHDKAMVDGYAVLKEDLDKGSAVLQVLEEVTAGSVPTLTLRPGMATRIMTGAPIPLGTEAVVMIEQTKPIEADPSRVEIEKQEIHLGQNIMRQATSLRRGQVVLKPNKLLRPAEVGLLSEVGRDQVLVHQRATVAVLATGNELVPAAQTPAAGPIRNSNGPMLAAQVNNAGGIAVELGIGRDQREALGERIQLGLQHDILVLSGGVSAGVLDLVPGVLAELGVEQVFHKVRLKPGKPIWFGVWQGEDRKTLVFGLPGNPVGSLVCFELFVRPTLARLSGLEQGGLKSRTARLTHQHQQRGNRPTYFPAILHEAEGEYTVELVDWKGSADLCSLAKANCLALFPAGEMVFTSRSRIDVFLL